MKKLNEYFEFYVKVPRIRVCKRQTIETLISDETLLLKHTHTLSKKTHMHTQGSAC